MTNRKLILPAELKVCANCTYWDGPRAVDEDVRVVVVSEYCEGECLVRAVAMPSLRASYDDDDCLWDGVIDDYTALDDDEEEARGS